MERTFELNTGARIPALGFGTWNLKGIAEEPVRYALEVGYRHIDTAALYGTERDIGRAVKKSGIPREELFITTKLWNDDQGYEKALTAINASLKRLDMDYVDLYLVHWPSEDRRLRESTWQAMEEILNAGKAKAVGVSNYLIEHLKEMEEYADMAPAANQIEMHPFDYPNEIVRYCHETGIVVIDYSPLARTHHFDDPIINAIAKKHGKSVAQVFLRWGLQHSNVVIPKSRNPEHIRENFDIFDFALAHEDMRSLDALDVDESVT